jgi:outer membrane protein TolC
MVTSIRQAILRVGCAVLAVPFVPSVAGAESSGSEPPPVVDVPHATRSMTMAEALAYAHAHQPAIRAALSRVSSSMADAKIPSAQWLPAIGVTGQAFGTTANNTTATYVTQGFVDIPRIGATPATASGSLSPHASTLIGAGLLQEIFDFGRIGAQRAAADALVTVEQHRSDAERLDIDFGVEEAFFSVFAAKTIVRSSDEAFERSRVHRDLAKRAVDAGLRSPIELTRAEADLAHFDVGRVRSRGGLSVAQTVLSAAIGAPDPAIDVSGEAPRASDMPALSEALAMAQRRDPRLAQALAQLKATEEQTRAVGAELRPNLSLTATVSGRAGGASPSAGPVPNGDGWVPSVPNWDVGVILSWPLFSATVTARRDAVQSQAQLRHDEIDVVREREIATVRESFVQVQVARSALVSLENAVVATRANYQQADARFGAGIGNAVELADAEAVRTDAEIQLALGEFELARARAAFGRAIAEGL